MGTHSLSGEGPTKQAGAHAYSVDLPYCYTLRAALNDRDAGVIAETKGKERALAPPGIRIG